MAEKEASKRHIGVRVVGASGLQKTDWFSKSDPYFIARVGVKDSLWHDRTFQVTGNAVTDSLNPGEKESSVICTEIGQKAWLFAKLQPGRAKKRINAT